MSEWKDTTSYSRNDEIRTPKTFTISHGCLSITVTCGHVNYRPDWILHCYEIGINTMPLRGVKSAEDAKEKAIMIVDSTIRKFTDDISEIQRSTSTTELVDIK